MGALAVLVVLSAVASVMYRTTEKVWPWAMPTSLLHECGRDFISSGPVQTRSQITSQGYRIVRHGPTPGLLATKPVWTYTAVDGARTSDLPGGCSVVLWVEKSSGRFTPYELEGGP